MATYRADEARDRARAGEPPVRLSPVVPGAQAATGWGIAYGALLALAAALTLWPAVAGQGASAPTAAGWGGAGGLAPNQLPGQLAALFGAAPAAVSAVLGALGVAGLIAGLLVALRTFARSRWLVLLALPGVASGVVAGGDPSALLGLALAVAALSLARVAAVEQRGAHGAALGAFALAAFFVDAVACPLTVAMSAFVVVASARRPRGLLPLLALGPALVLWLSWAGAARGALAAAERPASYGDVATAWRELLPNALGGHPSDVAVAAAGLLGVGWLLVVLTQRRSQDPFAAQRAGGARVWRGLRHALASDTLLLLGLLLGAAYLIAPAEVGTLRVGGRLVAPALLCLGLAPRLEPRRPLGALGVSLAVAGSFLLAM